MKILWILFALIMIAVQDDLQESSAVKNILYDVLKEMESHYVQLIIQRLHKNNGSIIDEISKTVSQIKLTNYMSFHNGIPEQISSVSNAYLHTLILYIYASKDPPNSTINENISDIVNLIRFNNCRPKVLVIAIMEKEDNDFEDFLKHMWRKRILDTTVLELSDSSKNIKAIRIHQYNPFNKVYTNQPYSMDIQWFPDKLKNMYGYPVKIDVVSRLGHNTLVRNSQGYPIRYKGPDGRALKSVMLAMNFTMLPHPRYDEIVAMTDIAGIPNENLKKLETGEVEMLFTVLPFVTTQYQRLVANTQPLRYENWCVVVPLTYKPRNLELYRYIGLALSVVIVTIFWTISKLFKFEQKFWRPLKIFGMLLTLSMSGQPRKVSERLLWLCIVFVSSLFSSNLYADLMRMNIASEETVVYETFSDLERSGLTPVISDQVFKDLFAHVTGPLLKMKHRAQHINETSACGVQLMKYRNIFCVMEHYMAVAVVYNSIHMGVAKAMLCNNLCLWKTLAGYSLHKRSPYRVKIDQILMRLEEAGIRDRFYMDHVGEYASQNGAFVSPKDIDGLSTFKYKLVFIVLCGYLISILTLFAEIVVHRMKHKTN